MRVVLLTIGIPTALALFGLSATISFAQRGNAPPATMTELLILIVVSTATALAIVKFRLPGGLLFGSMVGSGFLHGSGLIQATLPSWLVMAAVVGVGAFTGSRFANTAPRMLFRYIGAALGSFAVALSVASIFVLLL